MYKNQYWKELTALEQGCIKHVSLFDLSNTLDQARWVLHNFTNKETLSMV